jgi:hypothetical protein
MGLFLDFKMFTGSLGGVKEFLNGKITVEDSIEEMKRRLGSREENFLLMLERVYKDKKNPYSKIFSTVGYELKDIKELVDDAGVEGTMKCLADEGAYITMEEFKGKKEWVRKGKTVKFSESDFDNSISAGFEVTTGGTRSSGSRVLVDFKRTLERCHNSLFSDYVHKIAEHPKIIWSPATLARQSALTFVKTGSPIAGFYSQTTELPPLNTGNFYPSIKRALQGRIIMYEAKLLGAKIPRMEFVDLNNSAKIAEQVASVMREHSACVLRAFPSSAVRVCKEAMKRGLEIDGAVIRCGGEPVTPTKRREIEKAGVVVIPGYAASETGTIAEGCPKHKHSDEMHFSKDSLAVVQYKRKIRNSEISVDSFLFTSLMEHAPKIMINVELGDYGVLRSENCSCGFGKFGFREKMYNVRSFEKLTGEGMTLIGTDVVEVIEEDFPAMFGGSSTDYQVVEEEDESGFTHLDILVSPEIKVDEKRVVDAMYECLGKRSKGRNLSFEVWKDVGTIRARKEKPIVTGRGKLLSFQINKIRKKK